jgi:hypothetical protein
MPAMTLTGDRIEFWELLAAAQRIDDEGDEDANVAVDAVLQNMDDAELLGAVFVLHDSARSWNNSGYSREVLQRFLNWENMALTVAFLRFAEEPFVEAMKSHIPWVMGELWQSEDGGDDA